MKGKPQVNSKDIEVTAKDTVYDGYFRIDRYRLRHSKFAGGMSESLHREVFERGHVSAVLPVDPDRDLVVLIEQFRPGAMAAGWDAWLFECVAGIIESGEEPADVACRESIEEAGCVLNDLEPVASYLTSPGACSETVHLFCGRTDASKVSGIHGLTEEGEDIRVHVVPVQTAIQWLDQGRVKNSKTLIVLHWLARHYDGLKARWSVA